MKANAGSASAAQSFTVIVAPYAGVVGATHAELGDMATPGRPLVTLFDPGELRAVAVVPQATLAKVKLDGSVRVDVPALGRTLTPLKATVIPLADAKSHTTRVRLDLPAAEGLLPGQFVRVRFAIGTARMIAVPETALLRRGEVTAVYVLDGPAARSCGRCAPASASATATSKSSPASPAASASPPTRWRPAWPPPAAK